MSGEEKKIISFLSRMHPALFKGSENERRRKEHCKVKRCCINIHFIQALKKTVKTNTFRELALLDERTGTSHPEIWHFS